MRATRTRATGTRAASGRAPAALVVVTVLVGVAVLVGVGVLAGCGTRDGDTGPAAGTAGNAPSSAGAADVAGGDDHVDADVTFLQQMIPHHDQAVGMARIAVERATTPEVRDLAGEIAAAQEPEIDEMTALLDSWGEPTDAMAGMSGMDHGSMPGMMSEEDVAALEAATGSDVDRLFLQQMTEHHRGAVTMAQDEIDNGRNADAIALAERISTAQQREIETMTALLADL